jgi:hypothetical protein
MNRLLISITQNYWVPSWHKVLLSINANFLPMKKIYVTGFLWFVFFTAQSQTWKNFPDSISGLSEEDWTKSIELILELDRRKASDSVHSLITYLSTIYAGQQEASRHNGPSFSTSALKQQEALLQFLAEFVTWKSEQRSPALLKGMVLNKTVPFERVQYQIMIPNLINQYKARGQTDSTLYILSELKVNKNFAKQKDLEWYIYFAQVNSDAEQYEEAFKNLSKAKHRLKRNSQKSMLREKINLVEAEVYSSLKDYNRCETILTQSLNRMNKKSFSGEEMKQQTVLALAGNYENQNLVGKAIEILEKYFVSYREHSQRLESLLYLDMLYKRARLYTRLNNNKFSIAEYEKLLLLYPKFLPETDPRFINLLNSLGQAHMKTDQHHRAYVYFRWAYEMMNSNEVYNSQLGVDVISNLAGVYSTKGDAELAEFHSKEAQQIKTRLEY